MFYSSKVALSWMANFPAMISLDVQCMENVPSKLARTFVVAGKPDLILGLVIGKNEPFLISSSRRTTKACRFVINVAQSNHLLELIPNCYHWCLRIFHRVPHGDQQYIHTKNTFRLHHQANRHRGWKSLVLWSVGSNGIARIPSYWVLAKMWLQVSYLIGIFGW